MPKNFEASKDYFFLRLIGFAVRGFQRYVGELLNSRLQIQILETFSYILISHDEVDFIIYHQLSYKNFFPIYEKFEPGSWACLMIIFFFFWVLFLCLQFGVFWTYIFLINSHDFLSCFFNQTCIVISIVIFMYVFGRTFLNVLCGFFFFFLFFIFSLTKCLNLHNDNSSHTIDFFFFTPRFAMFTVNLEFYTYCMCFFPFLFFFHVFFVFFLNSCSNKPS